MIEKDLNKLDDTDDSSALINSSECVEKVLFIDLENCPNQINHLMKHLIEYSHIVICYAQSGAKIPIDWMLPLTGIVNEGRLKLIKMPMVGKNSADFGIAFWAGNLMSQLSANTHFDIASNDTDLDYVVSLLTSEKRMAKRLGTIKNIATPTTVMKEVQKLGTLTATVKNTRNYCLQLSTKQNRPAKKSTLLNSIKSHFKADDVDENLIFDSLLKNEVISLEDERIIYNQQKINYFASKDTQ
jgi:hypothetical protein